VFDLKRRTVTMSNSGVPYPVRATGDTVAQIESPGVPLGSFYGTTYDEVTLPLGKDDVFVFCSDGVSEAMNRKSEEFTSEGVIKVVAGARTLPAREIVDNIVQAVDNHRAGFPPNDDTTVVAVRIA
jgi:sigma-B regulation protein RsbU (phosphoserine phosphatase)